MPVRILGVCNGNPETSVLAHIRLDWIVRHRYQNRQDLGLPPLYYVLPATTKSTAAQYFVEDAVYAKNARWKVWWEHRLSGWKRLLRREYLQHHITPPRAHRYYRHNRGRTQRQRRGQAYRDNVARIIKNAMLDIGRRRSVKIRHWVPYAGIAVAVTRIICKSRFWRTYQSRFLAGWCPGRWLPRCEDACYQRWEAGTDHHRNGEWMMFEFLYGRASSPAAAGAPALILFPRFCRTDYRIPKNYAKTLTGAGVWSEITIN